MAALGSLVTSRSASTYTPFARAERVIAFGRIGLAAFSLAGIWLDPSDPETFANDTLHLLTVYSVYALAYWILLERGVAGSRRGAFAAHFVDLGVALILVMLTQGSGSPFFLFFTFVLLCASVRWGGRGAAWTGAAVLVAYVALGTATWSWTLVDDFEINRFVIRFGLIAVMTMILVRVGAFHERTFEELRQLARWPRAATGGIDQTLEDDLRYAARMLGVAEVHLLWRDDDSADVQSARWRGASFERGVEPAEDGATFPILAEPRSFLYDARGTRPRVIAGDDARGELHDGVFAPDMVQRYGVRTAIAVPLPQRGHEGWLLLLNSSQRLLSFDDVTMAEIVAAEISGSLERWRLSQRARDAALAEERLRVARDLHDGVLQSMTACRLGLAGIAMQADTTLPALADQLRGVERSLAHDQQELRQFIQHLRPESLPHGVPRATALRELCDRVQRQWRLAIELHPDSDRAIPPAFATELLLLCHEALVNVARHAHASSARVLVEQRGGEVVLMVADDGNGFPFSGRFDAAQLAAMKVGPRTLRERAENLGGTISLVTSSSGSTVEIRLPAQPEAVCA